PHRQLRSHDPHRLDRQPRQAHNGRDHPHLARNLLGHKGQSAYFKRPLRAGCQHEGPGLSRPRPAARRSESTESFPMNRPELIGAIGERASVTRKDADAVLSAFVDLAGDIVAKGDEKITIPGFLTIERTHRAARTGRNPATGETIEIPAGYSVKVTAGSKLK